MKYRIVHTPMQAFARYVLLACLAAVVGSMPARAQIVNGDFESNCGSSIVGAFQSPIACITGPWFVSHGTPDIDYNLAGNTGAAAYMWTNAAANQGEGIFIECPEFEAGVMYDLSFSYYSFNDLENFVVALTNGLVHNSSFNNYVLPTVPRQVVSSTMPSNTWQTVTVTFTPAINYSQLWFYPESPTTHRGVWIDSVAIRKRCIADIVYTNFSGTPVFTERGNSITASGTSTVTGTQTVTYRAGNYIQLLPDFHAVPNSTGYFHAYIAPCSIAEDIAPCEDNGVIPKQGIFDTQQHFGAGGYEADMARMYALQQGLVLANYPNPFKGKTTISYTLVEAGPVSLALFDALGAQVASVVDNKDSPAGNYAQEFDGSALAPGVYFLKLQTGATSTTRKIVVAP